MHHLAVINVQNCKQIWQSWAIPEKIQTGGGGDEYILFWKPPTKFLDLSLYPMKFQRKQASTPGNSAKFCDTPWKFQNQKPRSMEITWLFLVHSWKFHFFFNWPIEFTRSFFNTTGNSMSSTPYMDFSWNRKSSSQKPTQKQPKMTISACTKKIENSRTTDPESIKLAWYLHHLNTFHLLKTVAVNWRAAENTSQKIIKKCQKFMKILTFFV